MLEMDRILTTRAQVEQWRRGWERVKQLEAAEAKQQSPEARWRELNALFNFAYQLGLAKEAPDKEIAAVRSRWARLKANYS